MRLRVSVGMVGLVSAALLLAGCSVFGGGGRDRDRALRIGIVRPSSLDPMKARTVDEHLLAEQLFDTLVALDPGTAEPGAGIAASWTTSPDGLTWEFTLGAHTFAGGDAITAFDVEATYDRAVLKQSGSAVADLLEPVAGWREAAVDGTAQELVGVTAVGDDVVRIELSSPWADLPVALAQPGLGIVPRDAAGARTFADRPVGSGPYQLKERDDDVLTLERVDGRETRVRELDLHLYDDQAAAYEAFVDGDLDWSPVPLARVQEAATRYGREHFRSYVAELFYAFNLRSPKWADRRLREAVIRAVDRQAIIDDVYGGTMHPMTSFAVTGVPGMVADTCGEVCAVDPERAKAILAEVAAAGPVPEVAVDFDGEATQTAVAEHIERDLAAAGFTVSLRPKPLDGYEQFAVSGEQDLFRLGWIAAYPAMDAFVAPLFSSGSANNLPGFGLTAVDELIRQARATTDPAARYALYEQVERAVFSEAAVLPIGHFQQHWVASTRVRDLQLTVTGTFDAASVWLDGD